MSCADCFVGTVHEGTPAGYVIELHGLATYVAEPSDKSSVRGIVVIIPDAWGWTLSNTRVLADEIARLGNFYVYLPDFMKGIRFSASLATCDLKPATGHAVPLTSLDIIPSLLSTTGWKTWLYKP